jgi:hypothetical protein
MAWYVGLTDDPGRRKAEHGNPPDWQQTTFNFSESQARVWEAQYVGKPGYKGGPGGTGWRYGYWYTITPQTRE